MKQLFLNVKDGSMKLIDQPKPTVKENMALVENLYTVVSAGTERGLASFGGKNLVQKALERPDQVKKVLEKDVYKRQVLAPLAKDAGCTFLVLSSNRTYIGNWEDYGYREYGQTADFIIYADEHYQEGQDLSLIHI